jgi:putative thiazole-containing bacteriocin maturation protein
MPAGSLPAYVYVRRCEMTNSEWQAPLDTYPQAKVLAVGCGPFLISLIKALLESGLYHFHILITESIPTDRQQLKELVDIARITDPKARLEELSLEKKGLGSWKKAVKPFHSILYVSQEGDIEELRGLHAVCREEKKLLLPALCIQQAGLAGPLVHPDLAGCWESAWRRIHQSTLCKNPLNKNPRLPACSSTAATMLANVIVFEWFKTVTGVSESEAAHAFFLLNLETLEGNWHSFLPHPLVSGLVAAQWVEDFDSRMEQRADGAEPYGLLPYFGWLTSAEGGIFHTWEEGDLKQLPLAQCRVQAVDPLSEGPAELLPDVICTGLTHEEARREAGLAGLEAYVSRMSTMLLTTLPSDQDGERRKAAQQSFVGIGAGESFAEGVCRGLQTCLAAELGKSSANQKPFVRPVLLDVIEDERCRFYLQALTTMQGVPTIGLGGELSGFPVVWIGTSGRWYGGAGLNMTLALRKALLQALLYTQNKQTRFLPQDLETSSVLLAENAPIRLAIPSIEKVTASELLTSVMQILKRSSKRLLVLDMTLEPFLKEGLAGVVGVVLREEDSP